MLLIWKDLELIKEYRIGTKLCGIQRKNQRPDLIIITNDEINELSKNPHLDTYQRMRYYNGLIFAIKNSLPENLLLGIKFGDKEMSNSKPGMSSFTEEQIRQWIREEILETINNEQGFHFCTWYTDMITQLKNRMKK